MSIGLKETLQKFVLPSLPQPKIESANLPYVVEDFRRKVSGIEGEIPQQDDLKTISEELWSAYRRNISSWKSSVRKLRLSPWAILERFGPEEKRLIDDPDFVNWYVKELELIKASRVIVPLTNAYLYYFEPNNESINFLRELIQLKLTSAQGARSKTIQDLDERYGLLKLHGYKKFADQYVHSSEQPEIFLRDLGIRGSFGYSGFLRWTYSKVLEQIENDLIKYNLSVAELRRRIRLGFMNDGEHHQFRFDVSIRGEMASALLRPFQDQNPHKAVQEEIKSFLLQEFGDLRLNPKKWARVDKVAQEVFHRWLVEGTLKDFFQLLDQQARNYKDADRQWPYRSAFWSAYLKKGYIVDAWVVLGEQVQVDAQRFLGRLSAVNYATLISGYNAKKEHAVLMLRLGDLIVVEWSHTSKVRLWHENNSQKPRLYKNSYNRLDLVYGNDFELAHQGAERGTWQKKLEQYIRQQTGIRLSLRELMPND